MGAFHWQVHILFYGVGLGITILLMYLGLKLLDQHWWGKIYPLKWVWLWSFNGFYSLGLISAAYVDLRWCTIRPTVRPPCLLQPMDFFGHLLGLKETCEIIYYVYNLRVRCCATALSMFDYIDNPIIHQKKKHPWLPGQSWVSSIH